MTPLETVEAALERAGSRRQRPGAWTCPAHDDRHASLSVKEGRDGRVLLTCHAGCTFESIVKALGLEPADLFPQREQGGSLDIAATYPYVDEQGRLLFEVVRLRPKGFRQRRPAAAGGWDWKLGSTRRVLYRLPQVLAAVHAGQVVYVVEGEKDVHALERAGVVATCNPMGAGKWRDEYSKTVAGADVVIVADLDEPGRRHARQVAAQLAEAGCTVRLVGAAAGKDASDHLAAGHALDELVPLQEEAEPAGEPAAGDVDQVQTVAVVRVCDVKAEPVRWLWPGRMPLGKLAVVDGDPGRGKSTMLLDLAARVTTGSPMPLDLERRAPAGVVLLSAEDDVASTIRPRLEAAGADLARVVVVDHVTDEQGPRPPALPDDLGMVERLLEVEQAALLVVDPLAAFLAASVDSHRDQDVRRALHRLKELAERSGAAVACVRHLNKAGGANALYRGTGSIGIVGAARAGLLVGVDPDDDARRVLAVSKCNLGPEPPSVAFRLVEDELLGVARIVWQGESKHRAGDLLGVRGDGDPEAPARGEAEVFLREVLAGGAAPAKQVQAEARDAGISTMTLRRAREALGVRAYRVGVEGRRGGGAWWWSLPGEHLNAPEHPQAEGEHLNPDAVPAGQAELSEAEPAPLPFTGSPSEGERLNRLADLEPDWWIQ